MNHPYEFEDIEDYKNGNMSGPDRQAFEEELAKNEYLRQELEALSAEGEIMTYLRKEALIEEMSKWRREEEENGKKILVAGGNIIPFNIRRALAIAASLTLLLVAVYYFTRIADKPDFVEKPTELPSDSTLTTPENQSPPPIIDEKKEEVVMEDKKGEKQERESPPRKEQRPDYWVAAEARIDPMEKSLADRLMSPANPNDTSQNAQLKRWMMEKEYGKISSALANTTNPDYLYVKGIALFRLKNYREAADAFGSIPENVQRGFDAQWGRALALVALLPATCDELSDLLNGIENNEIQLHRKKVAPLKEAIEFSKTCPR